MTDPRPGYDEAVEIIADALRYNDTQDSKDPAETWDELPDEWREPYRAFATEALDAAYPIIAAAVAADRDAEIQRRIVQMETHAEDADTLRRAMVQVEAERDSYIEQLDRLSALLDASHARLSRLQEAVRKFADDYFGEAVDRNTGRQHELHGA